MRVADQGGGGMAVPLIVINREVLAEVLFQLCVSSPSRDRRLSPMVQPVSLGLVISGEVSAGWTT